MKQLLESNHGSAFISERQRQIQFVSESLINADAVDDGCAGEDRRQQRDGTKAEYGQAAAQRASHFTSSLSTSSSIARRIGMCTAPYELSIHPYEFRICFCALRNFAQSSSGASCSRGSGGMVSTPWLNGTGWSSGLSCSLTYVDRIAAA